MVEDGICQVRSHQADADYRAGIRRVLLPLKNEKERIEQILQHALISNSPDSENNGHCHQPVTEVELLN